MSTDFAVYDNDRKPGCLPRKSHPGQWCPMLKDHIDVIPEGDWQKYVGKISLRPFVKTVLNQGSVGSCATEATAGAVMISRAFSSLPHVVLNPWYIYRVTSGGRDQGSSIDENLVFVRENGIAPESLHPRSLGWSAKPSAEAIEAAKAFRIVEFYDITTVAEMVSALLKGFPVVYGSNGHAVTKVEHLDAEKGLDLNSWDTTWKDGGFGVWVPYRGINWAYGSWAIRTSTET